MKGEKLYTGGRPDLLFDIVKGRDLVRGKIDTQQYMSNMLNIICFVRGIIQKQNRNLKWNFPLSVGPPPPTVGQEAVELICQSERKSQKNATISL